MMEIFFIKKYNYYCQIYLNSFDLRETAKVL